MAMASPDRAAISTQFPLGLLCRLLRQVACSRRGSWALGGARFTLVAFPRGGLLTCAHAARALVLANAHPPGIVADRNPLDRPGVAATVAPVWHPDLSPA